jgi:hypothetical protein
MEGGKMSGRARDGATLAQAVFINFTAHVKYF